MTIQAVFYLLLMFLCCSLSVLSYHVNKFPKSYRVFAQKMSSNYNNNNYYNKNNNMNGQNFPKPFNNNNDPTNQVPRSTVPLREDTLKVIISGVVGNDPKEVFLSNGHYILKFPVIFNNKYYSKVYRFQLVVVGHFTAINDWEKYKPTENTWINTEMWDNLARENLLQVKKGALFSGIGNLIQDKWKDKTTGEEKKGFHFRFTKVITQETLKELLETLDDNVPNQNNSIKQNDDSNFSNEASFGEDQSMNNKRFSKNNNYNNNYNYNNNNDNNNYNTNNNKVWNKPNEPKYFPPPNYNHANDIGSKHPTWDSVNDLIANNNIDPSK